MHQERDLNPSCLQQGKGIRQLPLLRSLPPHLIILTIRNINQNEIKLRKPKPDFESGSTPTPQYRIHQSQRNEDWFSSPLRKERLRIRIHKETRQKMKIFFWPRRDTDNNNNNQASMALLRRLLLQEYGSCLELDSQIGKC